MEKVIEKRQNLSKYSDENGDSLATSDTLDENFFIVLFSIKF